MYFYKAIVKITFIGSIFLALSAGAAAQSVEIPPDIPGKIIEIVDNIDHLRSYSKDLEENKKAHEAIDSVREKIPNGEHAH